MNKNIIILLISMSFAAAVLTPPCNDSCHQNACKQMSEKRETDCIEEINRFLNYYSKETPSSCLSSNYSEFHTCLRKQFAGSYSINFDAKPIIACHTKCLYDELYPTKTPEVTDEKSSSSRIVFALILLFFLML